MKATLKFKVDAFGANIVVIFTNETDANTRAILKKLYKTHGEVHPEDDNVDFEATCFSPDDDVYTFYIIFNTNYLSHRLIAHETEHLKNYIFERFNYTIKSGEEELPAILSELLVGKIYDFVKKKGYKIS